MANEQVKMIRQCPTCQGEGVIDAPHCRECGQRIGPTDAWWDTVGDTLPCGHPATALVETAICPECGGDGRSPQWVSLSEWQTLRRRKIITGAILLIALLLPFAALLAAVLNSKPDYICGSWWYGLIVGTAVLAQMKTSS